MCPERSCIGTHEQPLIGAGVQARVGCIDRKTQHVVLGQCPACKHRPHRVVHVTCEDPPIAAGIQPLLRLIWHDEIDDGIGTGRGPAILPRLSRHTEAEQSQADQLPAKGFGLVEGHGNP